MTISLVAYRYYRIFKTDRLYFHIHSTELRTKKITTKSILFRYSVNSERDKRSTVGNVTKEYHKKNFFPSKCRYKILNGQNDHHGILT